MNKWLALGVGGVLGTYARYAAAAWIPSLAGGGFPYGTLAVNLSACLIIGFFDSLAQARGLLGPTARLLLMTGFCGAYSTFSTLVLETSNLAADGQTLAALINYLGSGIAGFLLLRAGMWLGTIV
ncbi:MAG: fluoride efflux transporter CrcB [Elusimicrobia bacterium]|nr:fluoride efflux transporter CrcB [Elusimicrobiota bacterium]